LWYFKIRGQNEEYFVEKNPLFFVSYYHNFIVKNVSMLFCVLVKVSQSMDSNNVKNMLSLSTTVHGFESQRGQLLLSDEEHASLTKFLEPYGFCFVLEPTPFKGNKRRKTADNCCSMSVSHYPKVSKRVSTSLIVLKENNNRKRISPDSSKSIEANTVCPSHSEVEKNNSKVMVHATKNHTNDSLNTKSVNDTSFSSAPSRSDSRISHSTRATRRCRREVLTGDWVDACLEVIDILEQKPACQWFISSANSNSQCLNDYLTNFSCPMDFRKSIKSTKQNVHKSCNFIRNNSTKIDTSNVHTSF
jgi:hypothetical protein